MVEIVSNEIYRLANTYLGDTRPNALAKMRDIAAAVAPLIEAQARGEERTWKARYDAMHPPLMWCQSCGTVSGDGECDCTRWGDNAAKRDPLPYEQALTDQIRPTMDENKRLTAALQQIADMGPMAVDDQRWRIARQALGEETAK